MYAQSIYLQQAHKPVEVNQMPVKKEESIYVRVSAQEKERLAKAAEREGLTFSEWVRWVLRKEAAKQEQAEKGNSQPVQVAGP
jgi:predicted DNA binding CopG/RHH family protein